MNGYVPRAYALSSNKVPAIFAGLMLLGGYVVGPALGLLLHRIATAVDDNLVEFTEGEA